MKNPMPATVMARMWYQPKGALSIFSRARRRLSLGSDMCAKSLTKLWKAALPPEVSFADIIEKEIVQDLAVKDGEEKSE